MGLRALFQMVRSQSPLLGQQGMVAKDWYVFFYTLYNAVTQGLPQPAETLVVGASPFAYQAVIRGQLLIFGGTVSLVQFSRDGVNFFNSGLTGGIVAMDADDIVRITYSVTPGAVFFPM